MGPALDPRFLDWILAEDLGAGDATTDAVVPADATTVADVVAKADGVLCGIDVFEPLLRRLDPAGRVEVRVRDGATVAPGQRLATIRGRARAVLSTERTALNVARHLSGVATLTAAFVAAVAGLPTTVHDTRKTLPGWRELEKYAVRCGGGRNHRMRLDDAAMVKENHLLTGLGRTGPAAIVEAVARLRRARPTGLPIYVEVEDRAELEAVLPLGVDVVMLDNFALDDLRRAVAYVRSRPGPHPRLEATGGITLATVRAIAETGVDRVSVGALTHSAPALDLSVRHRAEPDRGA
ncbi:MAG: carboxylating nicotinate-nucleotide diphosphorylase [Planctomycetia bacterium]|nr:carboxylating nicotinate-nucleotide diphosphorylase [Planctomycetia bacterium]